MTSTETPASPLPPAAPKPSGVQRIVGVLISPDETFASIARQPDFLVPLILILVGSVIGGIIFAQRVDFMSAAREAMEERGNMTEAQIDSAVRIGSIIGKSFAYASPLVSVIALLVVAAVMLLAFRLMGGEGTFQQAFATTTYAWMPGLIKSIIITIIIAVKSGVTAVDLPTLVRSNLAFLVTMKEHPMLFSLLASIDIFGIWTLVLFIIGFAHVGKVSKAKSAAIVITLRVVSVLFGLIGPAIQSLRK
ncbi:MAG TPA: Yip1 family protein [Thermoanaerobaculia bacterium]|nr:Yip1 family protein [Thermoanaerobaculia bacterium]